jgi:hypothetical protein
MKIYVKLIYYLNVKMSAQHKTTFTELVIMAYEKNKRLQNDTSRKILISLQQDRFWNKLRQTYYLTSDIDALDEYSVLTPEELYPLCNCDNPSRH